MVKVVRLWWRFDVARMVKGEGCEAVVEV